MWPKYIIEDNFLYHRHLHTIGNIEFNTKFDEWDIYKHKIYKEIATITEGIEGVNEKSLTSIKEDVKGIGEKVKALLEEELPQYQKFFAETELKVEEEKEYKTFKDKYNG